MNNPLISVVLPVHNGMPYLPKAVGSILEQTFHPLELIVVDDGSSDDTPQYLRTLEDPRVRYHRLEKVGLVAALNFGLQAARSNLIARMDADDIAYPTRLEKQFHYLRAHPECVLLSCQFDRIDAEGTIVGEGLNPVSDEAIRWHMLFSTGFVHPGAVFVRSAAQSVGYYCSDYPVAQDYDLWTRLSGRGDLANIPEKLLQYRSYDASTSVANQARQREYASRIAGAYAASFLPDVKASAVRELHMFLAVGRLPTTHEPEELAAVFQQAQAYFRQRYKNASQELDEFMRSAQQRLRWNCLSLCRANLLHPIAATRWLRLAGRFDPENGSVGRLLKRRLLRTQPVRN